MTERQRPRQTVSAFLLVLPCLVLAGCAEPKVGAVLTYEVDRSGLKEDEPIEMAGLVHVVNTRMAGLGKAHALSDGQLAVDVYGDGNAESLEQARRRVEAKGKLAFRIAASPKFVEHREIIDLSQKLSVDETIVKLDDEEVARWAPLDPKEFPDDVSIRDRNLVVRETDDGWEALVLTNDGLDVMGESLQSAVADIDEIGKPQISFTLSQDGAVRFGRLTGDHVPTATGERYHLAILWDGSVLVAPSIESKISAQGRISGNFTKDDVEFIIAVLNGGQLPYPLREVGVRVHPAE